MVLASVPRRTSPACAIGASSPAGRRGAEKSRGPDLGPVRALFGHSLYPICALFVPQLLTMVGEL